MTFPAHFGENCVIPLQTVAELWCIKLCAVFFWTTLYKRDDMQNNSVITMNKKPNIWIILYVNCKLLKNSAFLFHRVVLSRNMIR